MIFNILSFLLIPVIAVLWRVGGSGREEIKWARAWYRDVLIPVIIFLYYTLTANVIIGFLAGGATNSIRMGYGAYDPEHDDKPSWLASITKDREGWKIRGIYAGITSFAIGLFPTIYNMFFLYGVFTPDVMVRFIGYILLNVWLDMFLTAGPFKRNVWIVETCTGAGRALVFLICR